MASSPWRTIMKTISANAIKLSALCLVVAVAITLLANTSSYAQDERNFWVLNNTGKTITRLYISPHEGASWGNDILGQSELPKGMGTMIYFDTDVRTSCLMDFKLVFRDGSEQTYMQGRNVCLLGAVQFNRSISIGLRLPN